MKSLHHNLIALGNAFKVEFLNFYLGVSNGNFTTCYPHGRMLYSLNSPADTLLDDGKKQIKFQRGMYIYIPPSVKVRHQHRNSLHLSIHFNTVPGNLELLMPFDSMQYAQADELLPLVEAMTPEPGNALKFVNSADLLVRYLLDKHLAHGSKTAENILQYQALTEWLQKRSDPRIKVAEMAHFMRMGEQTFARKFARDMLITPRKFNEKIVVNQAVKLLGSTELTLKEIAEKLHLADEYHFSRFFKRVMLLPPGAFRKELLDAQKQ